MRTEKNERAALELALATGTVTTVSFPLPLLERLQRQGLLKLARSYPPFMRLDHWKHFYKPTPALYEWAESNSIRYLSRGD